MKYDVTLYYNTGFNSNNTPDSPALLATATSKSFPGIYHWQDGYLDYIDINAQFTDVEDADYAKVGNYYYTISGIEMLSETRCARIHLDIDGLMSCGGIANIEISDGWANRAHVSDDTLFSNILDEPFQPSQELVLEYGESLGDTTGENVKIVCSTVDLLNLGENAIEFKLPTQEEGEGVLVPIPQQQTFETRFKFPLTYIARQEATLPKVAAYIVTDDNNEKICESLSKLQGIGALSESIPYFYVIPSGYVQYAFATTGEAQLISGKDFSIDSNLNFVYANVKNNKVFANFNEYTVISLSSGDMKTFDAHDITDGGTSPKFEVFVDPAPEGKPYCRPKTYKGNSTNLLLNAVSGAKWLNNPVSASGRAGHTIDEFQTSKAEVKKFLDLGSQLYTDFAPAITDASTNVSAGNASIGGALKGLYHGLEYAVGNWSRLQDFNVRNYAVAPTIYFPRGSSIQNYTGNSFYVYRTRLSDNDVQRFDKFLTMYGYAVDKKLEKSDFTNRQYFNYVSASDVNLKVNKGLSIRKAAEAQLSRGVRIWHVLPDAQYYNNNPIKEA